MTEIIINYLGTIFKDLEYRELIYAMLIIECSIACVFSYLGIIISTGGGYCLGIRYGKTDRVAAVIKYLCLIVGLLTAFNFLVFWILDFITHMSWGYFLVGIVGIVIFVAFVGVGSALKDSKDEKIQEKYFDQIKDIFMDNPICAETIKIINFDDLIKYIRIYRDGIALYPKYTRLVEHGVFTSSISTSDEYAAIRIIEDIAKEWEKINGSVINSGAPIILKFSDYGYDESKNAIKDISKYLIMFTNRKFDNAREYKKKWEAKEESFLSRNEYYVNGEKKKLDADNEIPKYVKEIFVFYEIIESTVEPIVDIPVKQKLKKW